MKFYWLVFLALFVLAQSVWSARVELLSGAIYHGSVFSKDGLLTIDSERGMYQFPFSFLRSIKAGRREWVVQGSYIELRTEPRHTSNSSLRLYKGTVVYSGGRSQEGFFPVKVYGKSGWVHEQSLTRKFERLILKNPLVRLTTSHGDIELELFEDQSPNTVANFISLIEKGFYNALSFHRVDPGFIVMGGDPEGTGQGGPGYRIQSELSSGRNNLKGMLGMADSGEDTAGSQFYILLTDAPHLDGRYNVFGTVLKGMDKIVKIKAGDEIQEIKILFKREHDYQPETLPLIPN
jgi:peptidyl-prolyl cis-trans isomerase B (cyclophilin B)